MQQAWIVQDGLNPESTTFGLVATPTEAMEIAEENITDFLGDPIDWTHIAQGTTLEMYVGVYKQHAAWRQEIFIRPVLVASLPATIDATMLVAA